jgi:ribosome-associated translation inhibitor RaiA
MALNFIGLDSLDENEVEKLTAYGERFYQKACRIVKDPLVILHVKKMKTSGKRCKYSVHGRIEGPSLLASVEYSDWDFVRALNKIFEKIESEIAHKFKTEGKTGRVSYKKAVKE